MFEELLIKIARIFKEAGLPYMIIGGQAVLLYGTPRMTKDIDITLGIHIEGLEKVVTAARAIGLEIIPDDYGAFVEKTSVLPARERETGIRVDLIFSFTPYERQAIARARPISFGETEVMFASAEDVIVHKIFAGRPRDLEDVHAIVIKNPGFDRGYVRTWLREFDRSFEDAGFVKVFESMLREKGPIGV